MNENWFVPYSLQKHIHPPGEGSLLHCFSFIWGRENRALALVRQCLNKTWKWHQQWSAITLMERSVLGNLWCFICMVVIETNISKLALTLTSHPKHCCGANNLCAPTALRQERDTVSHQATEQRKIALGIDLASQTWSQSHVVYPNQYPQEAPELFWSTEAPPCNHKDAKDPRPMPWCVYMQNNKWPMSIHDTSERDRDLYDMRQLVFNVVSVCVNLRRMQNIEVFSN